MAKAAATQELTLRIRVVDPPPDVAFLVQCGKHDLTAPVKATHQALVFEFPVRIATQPNGAPNFLGAYAQGPAAARFVYVNSGTRAGQSESCWSRRAKVPLTSITWTLIEKARQSGRALEVEFNGTGGDGGPTCATVKLGDRGWRVAGD